MSSGIQSGQEPCRPECRPRYSLLLGCSGSTSRGRVRRASRTAGADSKRIAPTCCAARFGALYLRPTAFEGAAGSHGPAFSDPLRASSSGTPIGPPGPGGSRSEQTSLTTWCGRYPKPPRARPTHAVPADRWRFAPARVGPPRGTGGSGPGAGDDPMPFIPPAIHSSKYPATCTSPAV